MLVSAEIGRRIGRARLARDPNGLEKGAGSAEGAIFVLLGTLCLIGALLVGYGISSNRRRGWLHTVMFSLILSMTTYVIIDLEFPRLGLIRIDSADQVLFDLRESMR